MNPDQLISLFQSVNRGTVNLIDSLSVLSAITELNEVQVEIELHTGVLKVLLENLEIDRAGLFLMQGDKLELVTTAIWGRLDIVISQRQDDWNQHDANLNDSVIGEAALSKTIKHQKSRQLPGFFTQAVGNEDKKDVVGIREKANALMYVPLVSRDKVLGVLCLNYNLSETVLSTLDQFFPLFAKFYVQTLMNFRYTHDLHQQVAERTKQLEEALHIARKQRGGDISQVVVDEVTGLPDRRYFCAESQAALACAARYSRPFSCCIIEVSENHSSGVLEALADILKMQARESDIMAYLQDRQFILSLPEIDIEGARLFANRIQHVLKDVGETIDLFDAVELQIGLSTLGDNVDSRTESVLHQLMDRAGQAVRVGAERGVSICYIDDKQDPEPEMTGSS